MSYLVWETPRRRTVLALDRMVTLVGSDKGNDLCLADPSVAPRHALFRREGGRMTVTDLHSGKGTRINGAFLTPDLPSTIEPGDFIGFGRVVLTYHGAPPPRVPAAPGDPAPTPPEEAEPTSGRRRRETALLVLAFLLVVAVGALVAVLASRPDIAEQTPEPESVAEAAVPAPPAVEAPPETPEQPPPVAVPDPDPVPVAPTRAPAGALPPAEYAAVEDCPELLELVSGRFCPVRLVDWDERRVEAAGADGRLYLISRDEVTKIEDRADLARRAARLRLKLLEQDADGRLALAAWCAQRQVRGVGRELAREVLALRPGDALAQNLLARFGER